MTYSRGDRIAYTTTRTRFRAGKPYHVPRYTRRGTVLGIGYRNDAIDVRFDTGTYQTIQLNDRWLRKLSILELMAEAAL